MSEAPQQAGQGSAWAPLESGGFVLAGLLGVLLFRGEGSDLGLHLGLLLALAALLALGTAIERLLGIDGPAPFHRIALGQVALLLWFYLRSALGGPGVARAEPLLICAGAAVGAVLLWRRRPQPQRLDGPRLLTWLAWWAALIAWVAVRDGLLATPTADSDFHAQVARLTAEAGRVVSSLQGKALTYPAGFGALNALWSDLSLASPVAVVNAQIALQAFLLIGLVLEAGAAARGRAVWEAGLLLIGLGAFVFLLPTSGIRLYLEVGPRLSHKALLLFPLTLSLRLSAGAPARALLVVASAACAGLAAALNPVHGLVAIPVLLATALFAWLRLRGGARAGRFARSACLVLSLVALALPLASDPFIRAYLSDLRRAAPASAGPAPPAAPGSTSPSSPAPGGGIGGALAAGAATLLENSALGVFPRGCAASALCPPALDLPAVCLPAALYLGLLAWLLRGRRQDPTAWAAIASIWAGTAAAYFLQGMLGGASGPANPVARGLLSLYSGVGLAYCTSALFLLLIAVSLGLAGAALERWLAARGRRSPPADLLILAALLAALFGLDLGAPGWLRSLADEAVIGFRQAGATETGPVTADDEALAAQVTRLVPPGDRVLTAGLPARMNPLETRFIPVSTSRALVLHADAELAWDFAVWAPDFDAASYRRRVCRALDLRWLLERRVRWLAISPRSLRLGCMRGLPEAAERYYQQVASSGDASLWRLREPLPPGLEADPLLGLPQAAPATGAAGRGVRSALTQRGPIAISGWACDQGSPAQVTVELELTDRRDPARVFTERHPAALLTNPEVEAACGGAGHGFDFAPVVAPEGSYRARLFAWDGAGRARTLLAEGFDLMLNF